MQWNNVHLERRDAAFVNQMTVVYHSDLIANRAAMLVIAALLLTFVYYWFKTTERSARGENFSLLNLSTNTRHVYEMPGVVPQHFPKTVDPIPAVNTANDGFANNVRKLMAALVLEFRLLFSERSFAVVMLLAVCLSILEVTFWPVRADPSFSAAYAGNTARSMLLFLVGIPMFYTGEAIHRDQDLRVKGLLWSHPIPNYVIVLAKFLSTLLLVFGLILSIAVIAIVVQIVKGDTPLELPAYLNVYSLIVIPNAIFLCAACLALHVLLRGRYMAYVAGISICISLFYFYSQGRVGTLYNPLLYRVWTYANLASGPILASRLYCLLLAAGCLLLAHVCLARKSA